MNISRKLLTTSAIAILLASGASLAAEQLHIKVCSNNPEVQIKGVSLAPNANYKGVKRLCGDGDFLEYNIDYEKPGNQKTFKITYKIPGYEIDTCYVQITFNGGKNISVENTCNDKKSQNDDGKLRIELSPQQVPSFPKPGSAKSY